MKIDEDLLKRVILESVTEVMGEDDDPLTNDLSNEYDFQQTENDNFKIIKMGEWHSGWAVAIAANGKQTWIDTKGNYFPNTPISGGKKVLWFDKCSNFNGNTKTDSRRGRRIFNIGSDKKASYAVAWKDGIPYNVDSHGNVAPMKNVYQSTDSREDYKNRDGSIKTEALLTALESKLSRTNDSEGGTKDLQFDPSRIIRIGSRNKKFIQDFIDISMKEFGTRPIGNRQTGEQIFINDSGYGYDWGNNPYYFVDMPMTGNTDSTMYDEYDALLEKLKNNGIKVNRHSFDVTGTSGTHGFSNWNGGGVSEARAKLPKTTPISGTNMVSVEDDGYKGKIVFPDDRSKYDERMKDIETKDKERMDRERERERLKNEKSANENMFSPFKLYGLYVDATDASKSAYYICDLSSVREGADGTPEYSGRMYTCYSLDYINNLTKPSGFCIAKYITNTRTDKKRLLLSMKSYSTSVITKIPIDGIDAESNDITQLVPGTTAFKKRPVYKVDINGGKVIGYIWFAYDGPDMGAADRELRRKEEGNQTDSIFEGRKKKKQILY